MRRNRLQAPRLGVKSDSWDPSNPQQTSRGGLSPFHGVALLYFLCELMRMVKLSFDESEEQVIQIPPSYIIPTE
jgi:hypothetical protein